MNTNEGRTENSTISTPSCNHHEQMATVANNDTIVSSSPPKQEITVSYVIS